jgi:hypothetical protein
MLHRFLSTLALAASLSFGAFAEEPHAAGPVKKEACASCHADLQQEKLREPARLLARKDVHARDGVWCSGCHGGDAQATEAKAAHSGNFIGKPATLEATAGLCGRCHTGPVTNYLKGPHYLTKDLSKRPVCTTCHGAHGVAKASTSLISEPLCSGCHSIYSSRVILKAMLNAEKEIAEVDGELEMLGDKESQLKLHEARSQVRGLSHALDLMEVTRNASKALELVDDIRQKSLPRSGMKKYSEQLHLAAIGLGILVGALLLLFGGRFLWERKHHLSTFEIPKKGPWRALIAITAVLGLGFAIAAKKGHDYMENDPRFCTSCHTMNTAFDLWSKSGHKDISCHVCHIPNPIDNLNQLWVYTTQRPDTPLKHAEVENGICEKCHNTVGTASKWNKIAETQGHSVHSGKTHIECVQCHATTVHRFVPPAELCVKCHKDITLAAAGGMAEMHCLKCHNFTVQDPKKALKPDRAACLECHEKRQIAGEVFPEKAPMKWECDQCHKPHKKISLKSDDCLGCHPGLDEGVHKVKSHQKCLDCHKPHGWTVAPASCASCHKEQVASHHPEKGCTACHTASDPEPAKK